MQVLLSVAMVVLVVFAGPALALFGSPPMDALVLVVAWPDQDAVRLVTEAGGWPIGPDVTPIAVLASSDDPGFSNRLYDAGALLVRDGRALAAICGVSLP